MLDGCLCNMTCETNMHRTQGRVKPLSNTIQLFAAAKCHVTPSRVKRFMKQIKRLKSLLEKFAAALQVFTRWRMEQTVNRKCMFYFVILRNICINSLHLCLRLLCRLLHCCKALGKYAARP